MNRTSNPLNWLLARTSLLLTSMVLSTLPIFCGTVDAQDQRASIYHSLTALELMAKEGQLLTAPSGITDEEVAALAGRALELLLYEGFDPQGSKATTYKLVDLAKPAFKSMNQQQKNHLKTLFAGALQDTSALGFEELRYRFNLKEDLYGTRDTALNLIEEWLNKKAIYDFNMQELRWCLQQCLPNEVERKGFSAVWTGLITPPHTGDFIFLVSPIDVNSADRKAVRHTIKVDIGGIRVIDTPQKSPEKNSASVDQARLIRRRRGTETPSYEWHWKSRAVALQAAQPIPIRVEMEFACEEIDMTTAPSAMLFWEGPTIHRQIITSNFLQGSEGQENLQAEFRWKEGGRERLIVQPSGSIDFAWSTPATVAPHNPALVHLLTDWIFELATSDSYLEECIAGRRTHVYFEDHAAAEYLKSTQRQKLLGILNGNRSELLQQADANQLLHLYSKFRFGAEKSSLDTLGLWMQMHADLTPEITTSFFRKNRQVYWELANNLLQLPEEYRLTFQDHFLETADGRCVLPVAYTIAYGHTLQGTLPDWVAFLKAKLMDDSLTSEQRINWLIARAQAAEINGRPIEYLRLGGERLLSGKDWLVESRLIGESEETQRRITAELVSRLAAYRMWKEAKAELQAYLAPSELPPWQSKLRKLKAEAESLIIAERRRVAGARLAEFQRRQEQAAGRGDDVSVRRYAAKIDQLSENAKQALE